MAISFEPNRGQARPDIARVSKTRNLSEHENFKKIFAFIQHPNRCHPRDVDPGIINPCSCKGLWRTGSRETAFSLPRSRRTIRLQRTSCRCPPSPFSIIPAHQRHGRSTSAREFDKEILPKFALGISSTYTILKPKGGIASDGFQNLTLSAKYQLWEAPAHEFIFSLGGEWEIGNTGSQSVGVNTFSTFTPAIYFGKGFGDLPDSAKFFKPFAITGTGGLDLPVKSDAPNAIDWGFAIEYSLPYLGQHVKETGLPRPFRDMIPLVELAMTNPLNRGGGQATGTINPGVLWENPDFQVGVEAIIPMNGNTGSNVGVGLQRPNLHRRFVSEAFRSSTFRWRPRKHTGGRIHQMKTHFLPSAPDCFCAARVLRTPTHSSIIQTPRSAASSTPRHRK